MSFLSQAWMLDKAGVTGSPLRGVDAARAAQGGKT